MPSRNATHVWPFGVLFLLFAGFATVGPFLVLFYQRLGFSGTQIGALAGISPLVTFAIVPLWMRFADTTHRHRLLMGIAFLGAAAVVAGFPFLTTFASVIVCSVLLTGFIAPLMPFADNSAMHMLGDRKHRYGRVRIGGTLGYGIAAALAGLLVERFGLFSAFWACSGLFTLAFLLSLRLTTSTQTRDRQDAVVETCGGCLGSPSGSRSW